jgi:hypothetical protein
MNEPRRAFGPKPTRVEQLYYYYLMPYGKKPDIAAIDACRQEELVGKTQCVIERSVKAVV